MRQQDQILRHLASGKPITPLDALRRFRIMRLSGRILELREQGHRIDTTMVRRNGKRYASYTLGSR